MYYYIKNMSLLDDDSAYNECFNHQPKCLKSFVW